MPAGAGSTDPFLQGDAIERFQLDNGLQVVLHPDDALPLIAVNLWYRVGSRDERPGQTGLAHLFEHMLFQGSQHVAANDHFRYVQQVGGVANGSTWFDRTNYYETLPAHQLDLGLWLESDRMGHLLPALSQEKLATQQEVVLNERRQRIDNQPYGRAFERIQELLYPQGHPYRWPVIGYEEDIRGVGLDDVRQFFRRYYAPNNAVLTVAGAFDRGTVRERIERYFGDIPRGPEVEPPTPNGELATQAVREELPDQVQLPRVYLACRCPGYGQPAWYTGHLLALAMAGGKSSPLFEDLVYRRQIAKTVSAQILPTELEAVLLVVATAAEDVDPQELERALAEHLELPAAGCDPETLERARNRLRTAWHQELQSVGHRADLLSQFTVQFDDPGRIATELDRYVQPSHQQVSSFAADSLDPARRVTLTVVPA